MHEDQIREELGPLWGSGDSHLLANPPFPRGYLGGASRLFGEHRRLVRSGAVRMVHLNMTPGENQHQSRGVYAPQFSFDGAMGGDRGGEMGGVDVHHPLLGRPANSTGRDPRRRRAFFF